MKTSIILSLVGAMTLSAPLVSNAGDIGTPRRDHANHRQIDFAKATASLPPAPAHVIPPRSGGDIFAEKPEDCARLLCIGY